MEFFENFANLFSIYKNLEPKQAKEAAKSLLSIKEPAEFDMWYYVVDMYSYMNAGKFDNLLYFGHRTTGDFFNVTLRKNSFQTTYDLMLPNFDLSQRKASGASLGSSGVKMKTKK